jgi:hypothetical protein
MFNPYAELTEGLRAVPLVECARVAEKHADYIRRGQTYLVGDGQLEKPNLVFLREADALEKAAVICKILSLDEDKARKFMEELKVMRG